MPVRVGLESRRTSAFQSCLESRLCMLDCLSRVFIVPLHSEIKTFGSLKKCSLSVQVVRLFSVASCFVTFPTMLSQACFATCPMMLSQGLPCLWALLLPVPLLRETERPLCRQSSLPSTLRGVVRGPGLASVANSIHVLAHELQPNHPLTHCSLLSASPIRAG